MKHKQFRAAAGFLAAVLLLCSPCAAAPTLSARSALLMDGFSGETLYAQNAAEQSLIASTTKIMTGLLIAENCDLKQAVSIPQEAAGVEGSSLYLKAHEVLTVGDLLYGLMLQSGNDAAVALALVCDGSVEAFTKRMNRRAQELHLTHTHFGNPHGLDCEENYSTAEDLAKLAAAALENDTFRTVVSTRSVTIGQRQLTNHNKLLWRYDGAIGVKTGYTKKAGRILVSAAERDGRRLIAVTICDPNDWADHVQLLDYGFSRYTCRTVTKAGQKFAEVPLFGGGKLIAVAEEDFMFPLLPDEHLTVKLQLPRILFALPNDVHAGSAVFLLHGREVGTVPLRWQN